ncbi:armadillo-type protein [Schizophyllum amplum]|uniref:Armadillo-type protein n=1 Tax=Schizophyllum amplum TaxID=97359 RepID=A0A550C6I1_9AGAR|nr:armadillo-type protein [Auriculariopsis ampla]
MVANTRKAAQPALQKLKFREKLITKGTPTDALLKKLKALHEELRALPQDNVDQASMNAVSKELVNKSITLHKDRGVKAYAACCLADIFKLYAPDAPYAPEELRDIFQFFFQQLLSGLKGSDAPYYDQYYYLLQSLSEVKSVVLVCDLPGSEELMLTIFHDFFTLVRRNLAKKVEMFLEDIMVAVLDEASTVHTDVLDKIIAQFKTGDTPTDKSARRLAAGVLRATAGKLSTRILQYFTDIIVSHGDPEDEDYDEIREAHTIIERLNRDCPAVLVALMPQLEEELRVEAVELRLIATTALGHMYAHPNGADLVKKFPQLWNMWLGRKNDKLTVVRLKFVEATKGLLVNLQEQRPVIEESLQQKLLDPDEKVRAAVCKVYSHLDYETVLHHVSLDQLKAIAGRGIDKRVSVRVEALSCLGKMYNQAYTQIENKDVQAVRHFSWIPQEILSAFGVRTEVKVNAEQALLDYILPLPSPNAPSTSKNIEVDEAAWTDRLLNVMQYLQKDQVNTLLAATGLKHYNVSPPSDDRCERLIQKQGGTIDDSEERVTHRLNAVIQHISASFPEPVKAAEDLKAFAKMNENRLYKLLRNAMDVQVDLKALVKSTNEFTRRLESQSPGILQTMSLYLRRATLRVVNTSSIPTLLRRMRVSAAVDAGERRMSTAMHEQALVIAAHARTVLRYVAKTAPALFMPHVAALTELVLEEDEEDAGHLETGLQALAALASHDETLAPSDGPTMARMRELVMGENEQHAKFAAKFCAFANEKESVCMEIVEDITRNLPEATAEQLVAHVAVLVQFARYQTDAFEYKSDVIMSFLLKEVLMQTIPADPDADKDVEWIPDDEMWPELRAKILAVKACRWRCMSYAASDKALLISKPVLVMLVNLIEGNGSFAQDGAMSRMRLQAAISLLHLSTVTVPQDSCYDVRHAFLSRLFKFSGARKIPARFNIIPFLTVHDPEEDIKTMASAYIHSCLKRFPAAARVENMESIFIHLLHLLAHHPDMDGTHESLVDMAAYIKFYLNLVANAETVSLLYHLAMKGKTVRDAEEECNEKLWMVCELAQELIKLRAQAHGWNIQSYPGKVKLPSDILRPQVSPEAANQVVKHVYLSDETLDWLKESSKPAQNKEKKERKTTGKRKASSAPKTNGTTKYAPFQLRLI